MKHLKQKTDLLGNISGVVGATLCCIAVVLRLFAGSNPSGVIIAPRNIFLGAIALMVFGCWLKLTAR